MGKLFHSDPVIPHYAAGYAPGVMKIGHIFTIEPMINEGVFEVKTWPNKWTVVHFDIAKRVGDSGRTEVGTV